MNRINLAVAVPFVILVAATLVSAEGLAGHAAEMAIVAVASFKAAVIGSEFMEIRHAHRGLAAGFGLWLVAVTSMLGWFYSVSQP